MESLYFQPILYIPFLVSARKLFSVFLSIDDNFQLLTINERHKYILFDIFIYFFILLFLMENKYIPWFRGFRDIMNSFEGDYRVMWDGNVVLMFV